MTGITRRSFVDRAFKSSVLTLTFSVGGAQLLLTPQQARAQQVPLKHLDATQVRILELLGETILPGSPALGLAHFIDHQLGVDPNEAMLIAKYFQIPLPYRNFYAAGLQMSAATAQRVAGKPITEQSASELTSSVRELSKPGPPVDGFPLFVFYMCLRSDAVDVMYGTPAGFEKLNIPYMEHIMPPETWNG